MSLLPLPIQRAIEEFSKLPGIGPKSAERLTFHLLRSSRSSPEELGMALQNLRLGIQYCSVCQMVTLKETCDLCLDSSRDTSTVLVVEGPLEVVAFERAGYRGLYHVLHGVLSPIDGMGPEELKVRELLERVKARSTEEVILALDPDPEGEATALFLQHKLQSLVPKITRLAHGLPVGADIEFADQVTLREALTGRRPL